MTCKDDCYHVNGTYCYIQNLVPGKQYSYAIRSANDFGESEASSSTSFIAGWKPYPPTGVQTQNLVGKIVKITWDEP